MAINSKDFNPRSPHGERHKRRINCYWALQFQSTLPARGATMFLLLTGNLLKFQSTLPARGATSERQKLLCIECISIHAPRTGSDSLLATDGVIAKDFNPRSPHGERPGPQ